MTHHPHQYRPGDRFEDEHGEPQIVECVIASVLYYRDDRGQHSTTMGTATWLSSAEQQEADERMFLDRVRHQLPMQPDRRIDELDYALTFRPSSEQLETTPER